MVPPELQNLLGGRGIDSGGLTCGLVASYTDGEGDGNNRFVSGVLHAGCSEWSCDAPGSVHAKARNISLQLNEAITQLPADKNGIVHVAVETLDGTRVERERFKKIYKSLSSWTPLPTNLSWFFCHFLQSDATPQDDWTFDETVSYFSLLPMGTASPITDKFVIVPAQNPDENIVHWQKPR